MSYNLQLTEEAEADILQAFLWYESKRECLGGDFLLNVKAIIKNIQRDSRMFPTVYNQKKRALVHRFPNAIFLEIHDQDIWVLAVMHTSRSPMTWKKRKV
ncbi:MAG: type II toxin-antitoxin system RelE/ParE family toxin [Bacteroidota bacterium]